MTDDLPTREPEEFRQDCARKLRAVDCAAAKRVLAARFTKNWHDDNRCLAQASDEEILDAMASEDYAQTAQSLRALIAKYS